MNQKIYEALKVAAQEINEIDEDYGFYALRKINALNENSPLKDLIRTGKDLVLMASKLEN